MKGQVTETIPERLTARGSRGELSSLITGAESLEELKQLIIAYSQACPPELEPSSFSVSNPVWLVLRFADKSDQQSAALNLSEPIRT